VCAHWRAVASTADIIVNGFVDVLAAADRPMPPTAAHVEFTAHLWVRCGSVEPALSGNLVGEGGSRFPRPTRVNDCRVRSEVAGRRVFGGTFGVLGIRPSPPLEMVEREAIEFVSM
jgi:hypothetical protein